MTGYQVHWALEVANARDARHAAEVVWNEVFARTDTPTERDHCVFFVVETTPPSSTTPPRKPLSKRSQFIDLATRSDEEIVDLAESEHNDPPYVAGLDRDAVVALANSAADMVINSLAGSVHNEEVTVTAIKLMAKTIGTLFDKPDADLAVVLEEN